MNIQAQKSEAILEGEHVNPKLIACKDLEMVIIWV